MEMQQQQKSGSPEVVMAAGDSLFGTWPTDVTWESSSVLTFNPSTTITDRMLTFEIPKLPSDTCMFPQDLMLAMKVRLVDKSGNIPPQNANPAPINNFPSTMFR